MPFVGPYQPLVQKPTQQALNQSYGGGSFFQPPITQNTLKPNATGLINPTGRGPNGEDPNAPKTTGPSQITNSPLAKRKASRGGDGDAGGASGAEKADYGPSVQTGKGNQYALTAIGLAPGLGIATGFTRIMQELGFTGVVGGGSPRFNNATQKEQFDAVIAAGDRASRVQDVTQSGANFGNDAEDDGGGAADVTQSGANFGNDAEDDGGGAAVDSGYDVTQSGTNFGNDAEDDGGGFSSRDSEGVQNSQSGDNFGNDAEDDKDDHDNDGDSSTGSSGDGGTGWT